MEMTEDKSNDNLILSDLVNDWILEPIVASIDLVSYTHLRANETREDLV